MATPRSTLRPAVAEIHKPLQNPLQNLTSKREGLLVQWTLLLRLPACGRAPSVQDQQHATAQHALPPSTHEPAAPAVMRPSELAMDRISLGVAASAADRAAAAATDFAPQLSAADLTSASSAATMAGAGSRAVGIVYDKAMEYHVREGVQGACCTVSGYKTGCC